MWPWIVLGLLGLTGAVAAESLTRGGAAAAAPPAPPTAPPCPPAAPPPPNPFYDEHYDLDFGKISAALTAAAASVRNQRDQQITQYAGTAAAIAAAVPGLGTGVAAVIAAAAAVGVAVDKIVGKLKDDPNGAGYAHNLAWWCETWLKLGYLPALPGPTDSLKAIFENLQDGYKLFTDREPYLQTIGRAQGALFQKWGGAPDALPLAAFFTSDPTGMPLGSMPPARDWDMSHMAPRLKLASMIYGLEYGVQCHADAIYKAAQDASDRVLDIFPWHPELADASNPNAQLALPMYAFLGGLHAALAEAATLAGKPPPPPLTADTVQYADGLTPAMHLKITRVLS